MLMRVCHVTPHLPPDQAANALLPVLLGSWARARGDEITYVAHPPRLAGPSAATGAQAALPGPVTWIALPANRRGAARALRLNTALTALSVLRHAAVPIAAADLVHLHSNGLLTELAALVARRQRKPVVLTLYGTEIWHYAPRRPGPDLFTRAYQHAHMVAFYSQGLLDHARALGLDRPGLAVAYPPVAETFSPASAEQRQSEKAALGIGDRTLVLNVKRLHPLAGQRYLVEAWPAVIRARPDCHLVICGTGPLRSELEQLAGRLGVSSQVTFTGLVGNETVARYNRAADLFVLPSMLEACPTVVLEALACGTRVISSDNPGGVELHGLFGADVAVVPKADAAALAAAIVKAVSTRCRARPDTAARIERQFRPAAVEACYRDIYTKALDSRSRA